jgi:trigger factor
MNITEEKIDKLNAVVKIRLTPEDYSTQFQTALDNYRKQVKLPGFRPGKVPMGLIKKQYGRALLAEEINKVIQKSLYDHINDNKLNVLGNPLPKDEDADGGDWDNPQDFEFSYELGLAPEIELALDKKKVTYHVVKVDKKLIDQQLIDLAKRYGKMSEPTESGSADMLAGTFVQLDAKGEILPGGIMNDGTVFTEFVEDKKTAKSLTGLKPGDVVVVDPNKVSRNHDELGRMLGITHDEVHHLKGNFNFKVNEIKRLMPAEVDQVLFDKIYGKDEVKDLADFRARVEADLSKAFVKDQDWMFKRDLSEELIDRINPSLPDGFLKRWIKESNEEPLSDDQLEKDYPNYSRGLKWQLIENKIVRDNELQVNPNEVTDFAKANITSQYRQYGMEPTEEDLDAAAKSVLSNREETRKIYDMLMEDKVIAFCKEQVKVKEKEVSFDDFKKMANTH